MEQSHDLDHAIAEMERHLDTARDSTSCNLPISIVAMMARATRATAHRLHAEANERTQRQLEITGRLAELERRMAQRGKLAELTRLTEEAGGYDEQNRHVVDLEAQITAQQQAIDDVWALVELTDGYGSPFWSEPGLDDTTPAQAVGAVLEHLRSVALVRLAQECPLLNPAHREAMAALNAADRQSDDDQICGS